MPPLYYPSTTLRRTTKVDPRQVVHYLHLPAKFESKCNDRWPNYHVNNFIMLIIFKWYHQGTYHLRWCHQNGSHASFPQSHHPIKFDGNSLQVAKTLGREVLVTLVTIIQVQKIYRKNRTNFSSCIAAQWPVKLLILHQFNQN